MNSPKRQREGINSSPCIRPAQIVGLRRKAKRTLNPSVLQQVDPNVIVSQNSLNATRKEVFNPFRINASKLESFNDSSLIPESLHSDVWDGQNTSVSLFDDSVNLESSLRVFENPKKPAIVEEFHSSLPVDWSLKTKIRFASPKPFPWRGFLKTSEEASGTTGFVRAIHATDHQENSIDTSANARFHQQCLTWMYPTYPWLNLFPRMDHGDMEKSTGTSLFLNSQELQDTLFKEWSESFLSLYHLLKALQCPYFYVCAPTFTALFRATGIAGATDTHVMITPTSSGFRKALKSANITFTMPLALDFSQEQNEAAGPLFEEMEEAEVSIVNDDEEPESFLESLGLSQDDFPSLNPKRRKSDEIKKKLSNYQTLVLVEGNSDVQSVVNFLIASRFCVSPTGPLAGVPPTIVSPCSFNGGTLKGLKVKQGWVKHRKRDMHCVEISGPIMPNTVQGLCSLFNSTQDGIFTSMLATYKPTVGFSDVQTLSDSFIPTAFATENLKDGGISKLFLEEVCQPVKTKNAAYSEINVEGNLFSCKKLTSCKS